MTKKSQQPNQPKQTQHNATHRKVLKDRRHVDGGTGTDTSGVATVTQVAVHTTDRKLETGTGRASHRLSGALLALLGSDFLSTARHDELIKVGWLLIGCSALLCSVAVVCRLPDASPTFANWFFVVRACVRRRVSRFLALASNCKGGATRHSSRTKHD